MFLRTGSVWTAVAAHAFCNWMGLPRFWGRVGGQDEEDGDVAYNGGRGNEKLGKEKSVSDLSGPYTLIYYSLLVLGVWGFKRSLWSLTESEYALASF